MRWLTSALLLAVLGTVQALSSTGNRLLVVIDQLEDKAKYSNFWSDLEGGLRYDFHCITGDQTDMDCSSGVHARL